MISDVIIAGAGIGGLTLAVALRRRGVRVRVFERAAETGAAGAGIGLPANGVKGLARLGLEADTISAGAVIGRSVFRDWRGRQLGAEVDLSKLRSQIGVPSVALHRARLHALLLGATGPDIIHTGMQVVSYEQQHDAVQVACAHGERVETQLLVGADGLHSSVRSQMVGNGEPIYSGYTSWRGVTPANAVPAPERVSETWGPGQRFGIVPLGFGEVYWFATANVPAGGRDRDVRSELLARFARWHDPITALIEATPADRVIRTDIVDRAPIERWHAGRVVLLGDAAHPMTPNMGQGAGQAIEDAIVLDQSLAAHASLDGALSAYEQRRVTRANGIVLASRRFGALAQWSSPLATWLRDRAISLIPASMAETQAARLIETDF